LYFMPEDLMPIALRVLTCYTREPNRILELADIGRLRAAVEGEDCMLDPDMLAAQIVQREIKRRALAGRW
jgi:hypothetical protein